MRLQKIGNSYMMTVPMVLLRQLGWQLGDELVVEATNNQLQAFKSTSSRRKAGVIPVGTLSIPNFDLAETEKLIHEGPYERLRIEDLPNRRKNGQS